MDRFNLDKGKIEKIKPLTEKFMTTHKLTVIDVYQRESNALYLMPNVTSKVVLVLKKKRLMEFIALMNVKAKDLRTTKFTDVELIFKSLESIFDKQFKK